MLASFCLFAALATAASPAQTTVDDLAAGRFDAVEARMTPVMQSRVPKLALQSGWGSVVASIGGYQSAKQMSTEPVDGRQLTSLELYGKSGMVRASFVFNPDGKLSALWMDQPRSLPSSYQAPPYADPAKFTEREVVVGRAPWALPGTLTLPNGKGPFPAVVLVSGSGPNDRDESIGSNRPFRDWAGGLASRGIAVLRYDKITYAHGFKMELLHEDHTLTPQREVVDGAVAAVALLRATPGIDPRRVVVLGHSQGGELVPRIGLQAPGLAGFISAAGPVKEATEDGILRQYTYLFSRNNGPTADQQVALDQIKQQVALVKHGVTADTPDTALPLHLPAAFWTYMKAYHPADEARGFKGSMLFIQGGRDYQVLPAELDAWKAALHDDKHASFKLYPSLNHEFRAGQGPSTGDEYFVPGHVDAQPIEDVAAWVNALPPAP